MKIYINRVQVHDHKLLRKKKGEFLSFLHGFNVQLSSGPANVEPVYLPVFKFSKEGNVIFLEFSFRKPLFMVVLIPQRPFIIFEKITSIKLEDE